MGNTSNRNKPGPPASRAGSISSPPNSTAPEKLSAYESLVFTQDEIGPDVQHAANRPNAARQSRPAQPVAQPPAPQQAAAAPRPTQGGFQGKGPRDLSEFPSEFEPRTIIASTSSSAQSRHMPPPNMAGMSSQLSAPDGTQDIGKRTFIYSPLNHDGSVPEVSHGTPITIQTPTIPANLQDPRLIMLNFPDSTQASSFRVLRRRLVEAGDPRIIIVSSAEKKGGKTTCAINLAMALTESGRARALLVEANIRTPDLANMLQISPPRCFSLQFAQYRNGQLSSWVVAELFNPWLHLLAIDPNQVQDSGVIDGVAFAFAIEHLKLVGYDFIVIDTAPILGNADINLIQDTADGVLLTAWASKSTGQALRKAVEQIMPTNILGIVLLNV